MLSARAAVPLLGAAAALLAAAPACSARLRVRSSVVGEFAATLGDEDSALYARRVQDAGDVRPKQEHDAASESQGALLRGFANTGATKKPSAAWFNGQTMTGLISGPRSAGTTPDGSRATSMMLPEGLRKAMGGVSFDSMGTANWPTLAAMGFQSQSQSGGGKKGNGIAPPPGSFAGPLFKGVAPALTAAFGNPTLFGSGAPVKRRTPAPQGLEEPDPARDFVVVVNAASQHAGQPGPAPTTGGRQMPDTNRQEGQAPGGEAPALPEDRILPGTIMNFWRNTVAENMPTAAGAGGAARSAMLRDFGAPQKPVDSPSPEDESEQDESEDPWEFVHGHSNGGPPFTSPQSPANNLGPGRNQGPLVRRPGVSGA